MGRKTAENVIMLKGQIVKQVQHQKMLQKAKASPNIFLVSS